MVEVKAYARVEPVNAPLIVVNMVFMDAVERPMDYDLAAKSVRVLVRNDDLQIAKRRWVTPHFDISQNVVVTTNEGETPSENWIKVTFENLEKSAWEGFISVTARKRDSTLEKGVWGDLQTAISCTVNLTNKSEGAVPPPEKLADEYAIALCTKLQQVSQKIAYLSKPDLPNLWSMKISPADQSSILRQTIEAGKDLIIIEDHLRHSATGQYAHPKLEYASAKKDEQKENEEGDNEE